TPGRSSPAARAARPTRSRRSRRPGSPWRRRPPRWARRSRRSSPASERGGAGRGTPARMRWLVTGGAGFLGINLVRHLLARGDTVATLDREPFDYPERDRITEHRGDIRERGDVERAVAGCDVVVHAAAA